MEEVVKRRVERLKKLLEAGYNPYAITKFEKTASSEEIREKFSKLEPGEVTDISHAVAGRLISIRIHGGIAFADLQDETGKIQLIFRKDVSKEAFRFLEKFLDEGDIVGVKGKVGKSKRGEISLIVEEVKLLAKALRPIPHTWYGLKDPDLRYRQRYVELFLNPEVRERFRKISKAINAMRNYLLSKGFVEVTTPILQPVYGGALARPFKTFHNFLKQEMYLRIAPELYLKRLLVGGFEKVFEIGPCFRNEDIDAKHNPEFLQLEAYVAYADFEDMMRLVEELVSTAFKEALGTTKVVYQGREIDVKPPWRRLSMVEAIKKEAGIDLEKIGEDELFEIAKTEGIEEVRKGKIIEELFSKYVEPKLIQPTFITHFPADISPLAKRFPDKPNFAQRFEAYIAGMEVANAYSEQNNPVEQYLAFKQEEELRKKVRKELEYMPMDKDFVRALEYGMPPAGGLGIGLARIFSVMLNQPSIKEVILFPALSSKEEIKLVVELFPELIDLFEKWKEEQKAKN